MILAQRVHKDRRELKGLLVIPVLKEPREYREPREMRGIRVARGTKGIKARRG